ncbi:D-alanyl-D-alanine carboxypeptidase/D-alanyl-D-alanine-endopeptidase [Telmatobacter bradus]|uniref:D-alanyl-D-alanine carboxypeptidase/D-alanyl-D-alanine endopeptidase n=1 Tax=Telmatobacter bradus TaxID=474953 RepID=UPI003B42A6F8
MKFFFCVWSAFLAGAIPMVATAQQPVQQHAPLADRIQAILAEPALQHVSWGISVVALDGTTLYARNDDKLMTPASNNKMITTAAAFALLPVDTLRWKTDVVSSARIDSHGMLHGDLVLLGVGDPTLSARPYPYRSAAAVAVLAKSSSAEPKPDAMLPLEQLADQLAAAGLREVDGNIVGDDSFYVDQPYGSGWAWDDLDWSYGAPISALTFNDNTVVLTLNADRANPGATVGAWIPAVSYYTLSNTATLAVGGESAHPGLDRAPGSLEVRSWGTIAPEGYHGKIAVQDAAAFTAAAFVEALRSRGIVVHGAPRVHHQLPMATQSFDEERAQPLPLAPSAVPLIEAPLEGRNVLASRFSPPVAEDLVVTNKVSQNLHAELTLRLLGKLIAGEGSLAEGTRVVRQFLLSAGVDDQDFYLCDGSGMSYNDRVAPRALTRLLVYAARQPWGEDWRASLPVAGMDGTLNERFRTSFLKGRLWAKTGTHSENNALSGYLDAASGQRLAFSILVNNHRPGSNAEVEALDRIVEAIAAAE